mgnify:CR=1 FL=1
MKKVELFWNDNCGPCRALKPLMRELAAEAGFELVEKKVPEHMPEVRALGLRGVPSVVSEGQVLWTGSLGKASALERLAEAGIVFPESGKGEI